MKRGTIAFILGLLAVVATIVLSQRLLISSSNQESERPTATPQPSGSTNIASTTLDRSELPTDTRRTLLDLLTVVDEAGAPIPQATLTCYPAEQEWMSTAAPWPGRDWNGLDSRSTRTLTDAGGKVALNTLANHSHGNGSVVWITHSTHFGTHLSLSTASGAHSLQGSVILRNASPRYVSVRGSDGNPVEGATVTQLFDTHFIDNTAPSSRGELRFFHHVTITDAEGMASLVPMEGDQFVFATLGGLHSKPWRGPLPPTTQLVLSTTCTVACQVTPELPGDDPGGAAVVVSATQGSLIWELATLPVRQGGQVAPSPCPVLAAPTLLFELRDPRFIPAQVTANMPSPGGYLNVNLKARRGLGLSLYVTDDSDRPLPHSQVTARWQADGLWQTAQMETDDKGGCTFQALQPGQLQLDVFHDGYQPASLTDFYLALAQSEPLHIVMSIGGSIKGTVTSSGIPVTSFVITSWADNPSLATSDSFEHSSDGKFELRAVPTGDVHLIAESLDFPRSPISTVHVEPGLTASIDFMLEAGTTLSGKVVDGTTLEPLFNVDVQLWTTLNSKSIREFGKPVTSALDGRFSVSGLARGENIVTMSSPGFPQLLRSVPNPQFVDIDIGVVPLWKLDAIDVTLDVADGVNPSTYWLEVMAPDHVPIQPFSTSNLIEIAAPRPAQYVIDGVFPDGSVYSINANVRPGHKYAYSIKARPLRDQTIEFVPASPEFDHAVVGCSMLFRVDNETRVVFTRTVGATNRIDVGNIPVDDYMLSAFDSSDKLLLNKAIRRASSLGSNIRVKVGESLVYVLLVDDEGAPVAGAYVGIIDPHDSTLPVVYAITDEAGRCTISRGDFERATLKIVRAHGSFEYLSKVLLTSSPDRPLRLIFKADQMVRISARDLSFPMSGIEVRLASSEDPLEYARTEDTNDQGDAAFDGIGSGTYLASCDQPGVWPTILSVTSSNAPVVTVLQLRRLGNVALELRREGLLVAGQRIDLWSVEFNAAVSEWSSTGKVAVSPATMRTDSSGRLRMDGVPHGEYRWQVVLADGNIAEGVFNVEPNEVSNVTISLP